MTPSESAPVEGAVPDQHDRRRAVQDDDMAKTKSRSRHDEKWELVPAYQLAYNDLKDWLDFHFEGNYDFPGYSADSDANGAEERLTVKEDYYRIILPRSLTEDEKADIDKSLRAGPAEKDPKMAGNEEKNHWSSEDDEDDLEHENGNDERGIKRVETPSQDDLVATAGQQDHDAAPRFSKIPGSTAANTERGAHSDLPPQQQQVYSGRRKSL